MEILKNLLQTAYVTNDMEFAQDMFRRNFSISRWKLYENVHMKYAGNHMEINTALAYCGNHQIEVIMPIGGFDGFYRGVLTDDRPSVIFHHKGYTCGVDDMEKIERHFNKMDVKIPVKGSFGDNLIYTYMDTKKLLGHYIEYICIIDDNIDVFADVPRN